MLWRMPADTHEQRIGIMSTTQAFFAHLQPTTSVSGTKVFPRGLRPPAMANGVRKLRELRKWALRCEPAGTGALK
jgi:hypothetical protein